MADWAGSWKGGRYYLDADGKRVFFIERRAGGSRHSIKLKTHDEALAVGELARFEADPEAFVRPPLKVEDTRPVEITTERIRLYLEAIHSDSKDHRTARAHYLAHWSTLGLDLRTVDRKGLRVALASFDGGHHGRTETLNAFARFLVREGDLPSWNQLVCTREPKPTRAERVAYSIEELQAAYARLTSQPIKDLFRLRAATGMHHTEIGQLKGCRVCSAPLPDKGVWIRSLDGTHKIAGVIQVMHKSRQRHRQPVDAVTLAAALRLRAGVPHRVAVWKALEPMTPSNLRHTFVTLAGEVGELVSYVSTGIDRNRIAQAVGHRAGSTMTADRYDKLQVPPMISLPLGF